MNPLDGKRMAEMYDILGAMNFDQLCDFRETFPDAPEVFRAVANLGHALLADGDVPEACIGKTGREFDIAFFDALLAAAKSHLSAAAVDSETIRSLARDAREQ